MEGKHDITQEPICGIIIPIAGTTCCPILLPIQVWALRQKFHQPPYNIPSDTGCPEPVDDCICAICCGWCVMQQMQRHMGTLEKLPGPPYLLAPETTNTMGDEKKV
mmetsp:Transcript_23234/g.36338  ORF Transcript_23234/g.36338 Transcript_23234/m.36338 type:complete len:106 (-) Transcript_23234:186-503(-)|eukprot:CAMPEP_0184288966 /NCGR_PEP_ID=MMETSP1049-20130417/1475_1 /TAXON_ID=77928 /ORGANISM="Proteomonas sulcata, Strain CCMP704" /LENGTH=105 /DNA_ID=CAMNT_0026595593 /DNA_START=113 /DNA_END=430 /DNA_ORIENTATION=-